MFLKRLELAGFKSFADRTELEFVPGITAVVGPNGSGKSNISDSIRWVLGEQSARSLRGGKMEDIIFAGSDARKAVNFGEVSLTLDNTDQALPMDFTEVTVTRRVHRSGESEYLINKQPCRLKDITELFMDTGIGKEAYSIIGQGRIEEILSTRSEDRRGIFEEASGIVKYKSRKKEAERKLDDTEQNLLRIHDLVTELEDQIGPLKEQSEKALRFRELKGELKNSEISMYVYQIEQLHGAWTEASGRLAGMQKQQLELAAVVGKHDAQLETHRWQTRQLESDLEKLQVDLLRLSEEVEKVEGQGEVLKERHKNVLSLKAQLEQAVGQQQSRGSQRDEEAAELRSKTEALAAQLAKLQGELQAEEAKLLGIAGGTSSETEERIKSDLLDKLNRMAQVRNDVRYAEQQAESLLRRTERLLEERSRLTGEQKTLAERRVDQELRLEKIAGQLTAMKQEYVDISGQISSSQSLREEAQATVRKWEQRVEALISRRSTMQEMANDYDGFAQGVKEVLKAKGRALKGIHGAVAELVKVPAEVELAIETALGAALQNIVVENESAGREAISFLKQRQLGRATFLPLDVIKGRHIGASERGSIATAPGFVGVAAELVKFDAAYENIFSSLLGHVVIAETLEEANRIAARCQYRYRVVTLEGDLVNPGGSMTGGSQHRKNSSLLGRQRQIDELAKEIQTATGQLEQLRRKAADMQTEHLEHGKKLEQLRADGEARRLEEQQMIALRDQLSKEARMLADQLAITEQEIQSLQQEASAAVSQKEQSAAVLLDLEREEQQLQEALRSAELARKASESAKEELLGELTELKVKVAALQQEKQSSQEQLRRMDADAAQLRGELAGLQEQLVAADRELEATEAQQIGQIEQLNKLRIEKTRCVESTERKRAERAEWLARLEQEENKTKDQRNELKEVEQQLHQTEVRLNRLDVELDNLLKKLSEDYELSYELAKTRYPVPDDIEGTQAKVKDLKRQISALGEVNLGAIEEYQRVGERYEFLNTQKNDLIEAKTSLYQVIREMNEEMSKRFKTTFDAIRSHFVVVFAKLFGGGRADLILSEPDRLLDTGIEIVAQPPGKKLQNLQLLSGGERALTAMALLFSILHVKPVPFCVLDEVEAALDEANVSRFATYLREFSEQTQFIVVTHRKGTMEEADVLYGVTMEEGGVSKLVSVRLDDEAVISA
ncbi:chromosome segregation protein SMC [Paenibacillus sp. y28]|uniref:chromosome segregation protein SMC n=1 Tax=Paenibacillus sp. y28 TaxID=3129110 RepID=UPI003016BD37